MPDNLHEYKASEEEQVYRTIDTLHRDISKLYDSYKKWKRKYAGLFDRAEQYFTVTRFYEKLLSNLKDSKKGMKKVYDGAREAEKKLLRKLEYSKNRVQVLNLRIEGLCDMVSNNKHCFESPDFDEQLKKVEETAFREEYAAALKIYREDEKWKDLLAKDNSLLSEAEYLALSTIYLSLDGADKKEFFKLCCDIGTLFNLCVYIFLNVHQPIDPIEDNESQSDIKHHASQTIPNLPPWGYNGAPPYGWGANEKENIKNAAEKDEGESQNPYYQSEELLQDPRVPEFVKIQIRNAIKTKRESEITQGSDEDELTSKVYTPGIRAITEAEKAEYEALKKYKPIPLEEKGGTSIVDRSPDRLLKKDADNAVQIKDRRGNTTYLEVNTYNAWNEMQKLAYYDGIDISISFAYRSVEDQARLRKNWEENPNNNPYAAKPPGPHQTGRAIDIYLNVDNIEYLPIAEQQKIPEYVWLEENAQTFGFYGWSKTNPDFEAWHWAYNPINK